MKKIVIDLNIILDMLAERDDHESALAVYDACAAGRAEGYICSHEITTLSYFLSKNKVHKAKRNTIIHHLLDDLAVLTADADILRKALISPIDDYGDAVIDELARNIQADFIVTRNISDFKNGVSPYCKAAGALVLIDH